MTPVLDVARRSALAALADILVPAGRGMPSAGEVDLCRAGGPVDRVLAIRPDLAAALPAMLDAWTGPATQDGVEAFAQGRPESFAALLETVIGAYYLDREVKRRLGYDGQQALTLPRAGIGGEDHLEALLEAPARWRRPPATGGAA